MRHIAGVAVLLVALIFFTVSIGCVNTGSMDRVNCPDSEKCNGVCYNNQTHQCIQEKGNYTLVLKGWEVCNGVGYNPDTHLCWIIGGNETLMLMGWKVCGKTFYNSSIEECVWMENASHPIMSEVVVPKGYGMCDETLYNKSQEECVDTFTPKGTGLILTRKIIPIGSGLCNGILFNSSTHHCDDLVIRPLGTASCDGVQYNTKTNFCCNGKILTKELAAEWGDCGGTCYDKNTSICSSAGGPLQVYPKIDNVRCYYQNGSSTCPAGQKCCDDYRYGLVCYDPQYETCEINNPYPIIK
jgi:hypothetical protein